MIILNMLKRMALDFCVITTGTLAATITFLYIFYDETPITTSYAATMMLQILAFSAAAVMPHLIFLAKNELSKKSMIIRKILHIILQSAALFFLADLWWIDLSNPLELLVFMGFYVVIYALIMAVSFLSDKGTADELNDRLSEYKSGKIRTEATNKDITE